MWVGEWIRVGMATLLTINMNCSKVERVGQKELVSFVHVDPAQPQSASTARVRNNHPMPNGIFVVEVRDVSLQGQFSVGVTYPLLVTV